MDGQPLANVAVNFGPLTGGMDGAYAAYGKTDAEGRYTLKLVDNGQPGATIGKNRVTLNESSDGPVSDGAAAKSNSSCRPPPATARCSSRCPRAAPTRRILSFGQGAGKP